MIQTFGIDIDSPAVRFGDEFSRYAHQQEMDPPFGAYWSDIKKPPPLEKVINPQTGAYIEKYTIGHQRDYCREYIREKRRKIA